MAAIAVSAGLAASGCGGNGEDAQVIDWDLSRSHTTADVDWPKPDLTAVEISPVDPVRIRLPGGKTFQSDGDVVHDVSLERDGETVITVQIDSHPRSTDDAHALALEWARAWGVPTEPIEAWYRERREAREDGDEDVSTSVEAIPKPGTTIGPPDGPEPLVQVRYAFDDELPSLVSLQFFWSNPALEPDRR